MLLRAGPLVMPSLARSGCREMDTTPSTSPHRQSRAHIRGVPAAVREGRVMSMLLRSCHRSRQIPTYSSVTTVFFGLKLGTIPEDRTPKTYGKCVNQTTDRVGRKRLKNREAMLHHHARMRPPSPAISN
jgi:hypothetical protein